MVGVVQHDGYWSDYVWLVIVGALAACFMAWGIGANDVANAFATSVGARSITLKQACVIAIIMEFTGAVALGGPVTNTVAGGVADVESFEDFPELFAYGMVCALLSAGMWICVATMMQLAVSTTHSIVGAIVGFALTWNGAPGVLWWRPVDKFPYLEGVITIVISWFASPLLSGLLAALLFLLNRFFILRRENSSRYVWWIMPPLVGITVFINMFFVLLKGASNTVSWDAGKAAWVAAVIGGGVMLLMATLGVRLLQWRHEQHLAMLSAPQKSLSDEDHALALALEADAEQLPGSWPAKLLFYCKKLIKLTMRGMEVDIHEGLYTDERAIAMHTAAEIFDPRTEMLYQYVQVFSACCVSFAHGANDVANAVGPFAAIWSVYRNWVVTSTAATPVWILAMGGAGLVLGLSTYGYNVIRALGVKMAKMTPSRGYCAELATALTISLASMLGLPVSTTQCVVGAEMGVGLCENLVTGGSWLLFGKTFVGWVTTLLVTGLLSSAIFAWGAYSPSIIMERKASDYESFLRAVATAQYASVQAANMEIGNATANATYSAQVEAAVAAGQQALLDIFNARENGYINSSDLLNWVTNSLKLYTNNSAVIVGYKPGQGSFDLQRAAFPRLQTASAAGSAGSGEEGPTQDQRQRQVAEGTGGIQGPRQRMVRAQGRLRGRA
eukprot:CAMPEP_0202915878 /NCGR_PEP_ID=MMETSP1392-20130828/66936_1 /ASSEMBLY_ACC=CAM_ASM_000868 /TAXON_ID=225041 /ORGANISM="Chlamydomonas chlamydogama, Strain SAG 11-48b" /LENGTH=670 /DNA_ID=CAMNT_0049608077 /DNA_START=106 /DNA_END=2118 /DNA_ORIENTATION=+